MISESLAILGVTGCIVFIFIRSHSTDYALSILPLMAVPAVHLIMHPISRLLARILHISSFRLILSFSDIAALAVSCMFVLVLAAKLKNKKSKKIYLALMCGYQVILTCVYVYETMRPLLS